MTNPNPEPCCCGHPLGTHDKLLPQACTAEGCQCEAFTPRGKKPSPQESRSPELRPQLSGRAQLSIPKTLSAELCGLKQNRTMVGIDGGARKPSVGVRRE